jgi:hypothetical protein
MRQRFGKFIERQAGSGEYLKLGFSPSSIPLQQRWRNNGLSADFLADYLSTFFPGEDPASNERQAEIKDAVSYVANELLENAMKFSYEPSQHTVSIEMFLETDVIRLYAINCLDPSTLQGFQAFIQRLLTEDADELYREQLERSVEDHMENTSGLGFLTMLNDYGATLAWEFTDLGESGDGVTVTVMAQWSV